MSHVINWNKSKFYDPAGYPEPLAIRLSEIEARELIKQACNYAASIGCIDLVDAKHKDIFLIDLAIKLQEALK